MMVTADFECWVLLVIVYINVKTSCGFFEFHKIVRKKKYFL